MNRKLMDFWVGVFVASGFAALVFLALKAGNASTIQSNAETYVIQAEFDNIGGLKVQAPVKSAGVVIGRVTGVTLNSIKGEAVVTMRIGKQYPFSRDTSAEILTSGLLGEQYVGLESGGDTVTLKDGDKLDPTLVSSAIIMERALTQFMLNKAEEKPASAAAPAADPLE